MPSSSGCSYSRLLDVFTGSERCRGIRVLTSTTAAPQAASDQRLLLSGARFRRPLEQLSHEVDTTRNDGFIRSTPTNSKSVPERFYRTFPNGIRTRTPENLWQPFRSLWKRMAERKSVRIARRANLRIRDPVADQSDVTDGSTISPCCRISNFSPRLRNSSTLLTILVLSIWLGTPSGYSTSSKSQ